VTMYLGSCNIGNTNAGGAKYRFVPEAVRSSDEMRKRGGVVFPKVDITVTNNGIWLWGLGLIFDVYFFFFSFFPFGVFLFFFFSGELYWVYGSFHFSSGII